MAVTARALSLRELADRDPHLAALLPLLGNAGNLGGLATLAGMGRPFVVDQPFVVGSVSGAITQTFSAATPSPQRSEIGLVGPVSVSLSAQRICAVSVLADSGAIVQEQAASGGVKWGGEWYLFRTQAEVVVQNLNANFYVAGQVMFVAWYLRDELAARIRRVLHEVLG